MNKLKAITSLTYSIGQITFGLLIHPYQTMQTLVKDKVFVWMTLLPSISLAITTTLWRFVIVPLVRQVFSCALTNFWGCQWLAFFSDWITFFCIYWQLILLYLLVRFRRAYSL